MRQRSSTQKVKENVKNEIKERKKIRMTLARGYFAACVKWQETCFVFLQETSNNG